MIKKEIIVLHEYGAAHHYRSLKHLIDNNDSPEIKFYEFSITNKIFKSVVKMDWRLLTKQVYNILNLLNLTLSKNKRIVLGIVPFDYRIYFLLLILRNHKIYYHTSWPYWHNEAAPVRHKLFYSGRLLKCWEKLLTNSFKAIFAVSMCAKNSLIVHKNVDPNKISVVYHSFDSAVYYPGKNGKSDGIVNFLYVGRLTKSKGIDKIISFFRKNGSGVCLTIVGDGDLRLEVEGLAKECKHVTYMNHMENPDSLADVYREAHFLLLPTVKQELFGMVLIEAMACGVVPIASSLVGPKEIIRDNYNGYLTEERDFEKKIESIISRFDFFTYLEVRDNAIEKASEFTVENISVRWRSILDD